MVHPTRPQGICCHCPALMTQFSTVQTKPCPISGLKLSNTEFKLGQSIFNANKHNQIVTCNNLV